MQISGCCRKNESSADVPPFCVPPMTKSTRMFRPQIDTDFHRFERQEDSFSGVCVKRLYNSSSEWPFCSTAVWRFECNRHPLLRPVQIETATDKGAFSYIIELSVTSADQSFH